MYRYTRYAVVSTCGTFGLYQHMLFAFGFEDTGQEAQSHTKQASGAPLESCTHNRLPGTKYSKLYASCWPQQPRLGEAGAEEGRYALQAEEGRYALPGSVYYTPIEFEFNNTFGRQRACMHLLVNEHTCGQAYRRARWRTADEQGTSNARTCMRLKTKHEIVFKYEQAHNVQTPRRSDQTPRAVVEQQDTCTRIGCADLYWA